MYLIYVKNASQLINPDHLKNYNRAGAAVSLGNTLPKNLDKAYGFIEVEDYKHKDWNEKTLTFVDPPPDPIIGLKSTFDQDFTETDKEKIRLYLDAGGVV